MTDEEVVDQENGASNENDKPKSEEKPTEEEVEEGEAVEETPQEASVDDKSSSKRRSKRVSDAGKASPKRKKDRDEKESREKRKRDRSEERKSPSPVAKRTRSDRDGDDRESRRERDERDGRRDRERRSDKRDRDDGKSKDRKSHRDRSRTRSRSRSPKRSRNDRGRDDRKDKGDKEDDIEEGEVRPPTPVKKEPTARELERMRLIEEEKVKALEDGDDPVWSMGKAQVEKDAQQCPYLDTIDRTVLDFDFEKLCSVSLSTLNVYACLICGKYFQGRGTNTHAYTHSLDTDHHVFLNLLTLKFYCLPDNYEVCDPSLEDIKYLLKPTYTKDLIASLDSQTRMARAFDNSTYYPGVVGLNNIKANDYCNVILAALSHVTPLRNYFLREENYAKIKRPAGDILFELPKRFGELIRKIWNPRAFRKHVSPHEMLQAIILCSDKKFQFIKQSDAADFMNFFLNTLHGALNGNNKNNSSIIYKSFRGRMRQYSKKVMPAESTDEQRRQMMVLPEYQEVAKETPFIYLTLDLPPAPLYRDQQLQNIIPQVPLHVLLSKFNGITEKEYKTYNENIMKRFELLTLPEYLIITYKRFHKNQWYVEKNPTIVNFPISNVDLYDCLSDEAKTSEKYTTYDLVANVVHEGLPEEGNYRVQLVHQGSQKWFELEDLHVKEILPQMIVLAESYIQIWKLDKTKTREERLSEVPQEMDTA